LQSEKGESVHTGTSAHTERSIASPIKASDTSNKRVEMKILIIRFGIVKYLILDKIGIVNSISVKLWQNDLLRRVDGKCESYHSTYHYGDQ